MYSGHDSQNNLQDRAAKRFGQNLVHKGDSLLDCNISTDLIHLVSYRSRAHKNYKWYSLHSTDYTSMNRA